MLSHDVPGPVLEEAGELLGCDPVRHNVILTLLHARVAYPAPGRYWVVSGDEEPEGVVFQSPLDFVATITPMSFTAVAAAVDGVAEAGVRLPGVNGEAGAAARFAGQWTERLGTAAFPDQGQRIYEVERADAPTGVPGSLRPAEAGDRDRLVEWMQGFQADTGETGTDAALLVDLRLPVGHFWVWDDDGPVSLAALTPPVAGVVRVQAVYTPPERRRRGYAAACVAAVSEAVLANGDRCILYTDLGNPTSNRVYRSIGYQAVAEALRYRFA